MCPPFGVHGITAHTCSSQRMTLACLALVLLVCTAGALAAQGGASAPQRSITINHYFNVDDTITKCVSRRAELVHGR